MIGFLTAPTFNPPQPVIQIPAHVGYTLQVLASGKAGFGPASGSGGGTLGSYLAYTSPSGANNNVAPAGFGSTVGRLDVTLTADTQWTGLQAGADGQMLLVSNLSAFNFTLEALNAGSSAANRLRIGGGGLILAQYFCALLVYYAGSVNLWVAR